MYVDNNVEWIVKWKTNQPTNEQAIILKSSIAVPTRQYLDLILNSFSSTTNYKVEIQEYNKYNILWLQHPVGTAFHSNSNYNAMLSYALYIHENIKFILQIEPNKKVAK